MIKYIHTLNRIPAGYTKGEQICYTNGHRKNGWHIKLVDSVKQIKKEQKLSDKWRKSKGFNDHDDYDYIAIEVEK